MTTVKKIFPGHFPPFISLPTTECIPAGDLKACRVAGHRRGTTSWEMGTFSYMTAQSSTLTWQAISCHVSGKVRLASQSSVEVSKWVYEGAGEELERANPSQRSSQPTTSLFHAPCNLGETDTSFRPACPRQWLSCLLFFCVAKAKDTERGFVLKW